MVFVRLLGVAAIRGTHGRLRRYWGNCERHGQERNSKQKKCSFHGKLLVEVVISP